jgi:iron(III) transport system permease protein
MVDMFKKIKWNTLTVTSILIVLVLTVPIFPVFTTLLTGTSEYWDHIVEFLLVEYVKNTIILTFATGVATLIIGMFLAYFVSLYEFPMRRFLRWALILPLAIPPYIGAYTYSGLLSFTGVIQSFLRNNFDLILDQKYFDVMSIEGAVFIFTMFLFPYVYLITYSYLSKQSRNLIETSRLLGQSAFMTFWKLILPISRAALASSVTLVILEVLNDYGVVKYFGVPTFSTAIFTTWFGFSDVNSALRLANFLMLFVVFMLIFERVLRGRKQFSYSNTKVKPVVRVKLKGAKGYVVTGIMLLIFSLSFIIPFAQLVQWALKSYTRIDMEDLLTYIWNSFSSASIVAVVIIVLGLVIGHYRRIIKTRVSMVVEQISMLGYSIPASIIAIGVITLFLTIDRSLAPYYKSILNINKTLVLSTSIFMLYFAYIIRFFAIGYNSISSGYNKVGKKFFEASKLLGKGSVESMLKVDLPMILPAIMSAFILVLIDVLKELPLTLILRPFNFHTLATKSFQYANDEMIQESALTSLVIIFISGIAIYYFYEFRNRGEK